MHVFPKSSLLWDVSCRLFDAHALEKMKDLRNLLEVKVLCNSCVCLQRVQNQLSPTAEFQGTRVEEYQSIVTHFQLNVKVSTMGETIQSNHWIVSGEWPAVIRMNSSALLDRSRYFILMKILPDQDKHDWRKRLKLWNSLKNICLFDLDFCQLERECAQSLTRFSYQTSAIVLQWAW